MAEIISLEDKLKLSEIQKSELIRRRKILAVRKVFQCTHCSLKCEKCGTQTSESAMAPNTWGSFRIPYRFCESCAEEYIDYINRMKGNGDPDCFWRNESWLDIWKTWIDYQSALDRYLKSKEFSRLLNEIRQLHPED
ncbi:MAG: hypothetical protein AB1659_01030 [Thermodesulfobacteriota bacterium]